MCYTMSARRGARIVAQNTVTTEMLSTTLHTCTKYVACYLLLMSAFYSNDVCIDNSRLDDHESLIRARYTHGGQPAWLLPK